MHRRSFLTALVGGLAGSALYGPTIAEAAPVNQMTLDGVRGSLGPIEMQRRGGGGGGGFRGGGGGGAFRGGGGAFRGGAFRGGFPGGYRGVWRGGWRGRRWGGPYYGGGFYGGPYYGYGSDWGYGYGYGPRCWINRWGARVCRRPYYAPPVVPFPFFW